MKNFIIYLKTLLLFGALISAKTGWAQINQCSVSISYVLNSNGNVVLSPVTTQSVGSCTWAFGNGIVTYTTGSNPVSVTYTANGVYTVTLGLVNTAFTCTSIVTQTVNVNNISVCNAVSSFTYNSSSPNSFNFTSTSSGTTGTSTYAWNFGDGATGSGSSVSHVYSADGMYPVTLVVSDATPATCTNSSVSYISVCTATNDFTYANYPNGVVGFTSSAATSTTSYFYWTFGDGGVLNGGAITAAAPTHTYAANGTYVVNMIYQSTLGCTVTTQYTVTVSNIANPCTLNASFSYSQGSGNVIYFTNTSTGTSGSVNYLWNFGDGNTSTSASPTHTYSTSGNYSVTLYANNNFSYTCADSTNMNVVTNTCVANAGFTLTPSGTPQNWNITPFDPSNIASALWSWGDGSTSNTLYTSHTYSAAGFYTICLTVTTTCGAVGTSCWLYNIYKPANGSEAQGLVYVNVLNPATVGIKNNSAGAIACSIAPNPSHGTFQLNFAGLTSGNVSIKIYNLVGQHVYAADIESLPGDMTKEIQLGQVSSGVYFIQVNASQQTLTKKIVISNH